MYQKMNQEFSPEQTSFPQELHLTDYVNIIKKRKWVVITFLLVVVSIVAYKTFNTIPEYKATTQIIIEGQSSFMNDMTKINDTNLGREYLETQYKLLESESLASKTIEALGLRKYVANRIDKPDYLTLALKRVKSFPDLMMKKVRKFSDSPSSPNDTAETQHITFGKDSESEHVPSKKDPVASWYLSNIEVLPIKETRLVNISFFDRSPEMVARVANAHARAFIEKNIQKQRLASHQALEWLKTRLKDQKIKVETSRRIIDKYKYAELKKLSVYDENLLSLPEIAQNSVINYLQEQLAELKAQKLGMSTKYGPKYPKIVEINSSIEKFEEEIIAEIQRIMAKTREELDRTAVLEKYIQQIEGIQQAAAVPLNGNTANYNILQFEAESDQEIYDILLKQAKEIDLTGNMEKHNIRIVDEARIPRYPVTPNVFSNFLLSLVMGLVFGIGLAFFLEYMDKTIKTPENIMQSLGMSVIGLLPYDKSLKENKPLTLSLNESPDTKKKLLKGYPQYNISSNYIAGLPMIQSEMSGQTLLIESSTAGEGKTTVLAKSAITLARGGLRVVMVDADLHKPTLHHKFGLNNGARSGLSNAMTRILSKKIRKGTLEEYSIDDLFFLIALKRQSGRLIITNDTQTIAAAFENGRLFHIQQSQDVPLDNRLGTMLLRGGFITESQLKDALERNKRTSQPLGYILINAGYINQDRLQGPLKLQMEEQLQKLFSWKQGTFVFESGKVETYIDQKIYFQEDYTSTINRLGRIAGSRFLESEILSQVKSLNGSNLSLLPAGIGHTRPEGPLNYTLLARFLDILKQHFDVVLIDAPPLLETRGEIKPLLPLVDGVVFVIKSGHVSVKLVNEATTYLKEAKTKIIGTILNQAKIDNSYYGY